MPAGGTPRPFQNSPADREEITTTYRALYGGPAGLSASSWTSRSSTSPTATPSASATSPGPSRHSALPVSPNTSSARGPAYSGSVDMAPVDRLQFPNDAAIPLAAESSGPAPALEGAALSSNFEHQLSGPAQTTAAATEELTRSYITAVPDNGEQPEYIADNFGSVTAGVAADFNRQLNLGGSGGEHQNNTHASVDPIARAQASLAAARQQLVANSAGAVAPAPISDSNENDRDNSPAMVSSLPVETASHQDSDTYSSSNAALEAASRTPALVSLLTTGSATEQLDAAKTLLDALKQHGAPVQHAAHQAGGTHMLQTLVRSGNGSELKELCAAALANICRQPEALEELTSTPEVPFTLVESSLDGIRDGKEAYADLFAVLAASESDTVRAACAAHKAVRVLADTLSNSTRSQDESITNASLIALEALCEADPAGNIRKLAWSGDLANLVKLLQPPSSAGASAAMRLLLHSLHQDSMNAESLSFPELIEVLAGLVADSEVGMGMQIGAAKVLAAIAALPSRKEDSTKALNEFALPRACEILYQVESQWIEGASKNNFETTQAAELQAACALLVGNLALGSPLCCHVVLFHAQALRTVIAVLTGCHEFALVEGVLAATAKYAAAPLEVL